ncbi:MAG: hypothetical protein IPL54_08905 [Chitinophagaceae bacterium]|nr:hypothetical protein [Chitinophagaceae bacterium]
MQFYRIEISTANCIYQISINGLPVLFDKKGYRTDTHLNVNHLIKDKSLGIEYEIMPISGETILGKNVLFELKIIVNEKDQEQQTEVFSYTYDNQLAASNVSQIKIIKIPQVEFSPYWLNTKKIDLVAESENLIKQYRLIWNAFNEKNIDAIISLFQIRENTYADSYGEVLSSRIKDTSAIYQSYFVDSEYYLYPFSPQFFMLKQFGYGKLICLEEENGFPPIFYLNKEGTKGRYIPIYFGLVENELKVLL